MKINFNRKINLLREKRLERELKKLFSKYKRNYMKTDRKIKQEKSLPVKEIAEKLNKTEIKKINKENYLDRFYNKYVDFDLDLCEIPKKEWTYPGFTALLIHPDTGKMYLLILNTDEKEKKLKKKNQEEYEEFLREKYFSALSQFVCAYITAKSEIEINRSIMLKECIAVLLFRSFGFKREFNEKKLEQVYKEIMNDPLEKAIDEEFIETVIDYYNMFLDV